MKVNVLGVKIDDITMDQAAVQVSGWLKEAKKPFDKTQGKRYIVTPNPEIIITAQKDPRYKSILNDADLSIPDGVGLKLSGKVKNIFAGVDFMEELIKRSVDSGSTIGLIGAKDRVAEKAAECLRKKYPGVQIVYANNGGVIDEQGEWVEGNRRALVKMDLLFVAFGPPKQEKWIASNLKKLDVKVAMGVGGSLDYISGEVKRAPKMVRALGFEWLFRLIFHPWRIKRQLALIKYLYMLTLNHDSK